MNSGKASFYSFKECREEISVSKRRNKFSNKLKAFIIERFYYGNTPIVEICKHTGLWPQVVTNILNQYKTPFNIDRVIISKKSKV